MYDALNPFESLPPKVGQAFTQVFALLWGLGYSAYGIVALDRFAMVIGVVLLLATSYIGRMDFEDQRWWK